MALEPLDRAALKAWAPLRIRGPTHGKQLTRGAAATEPLSQAWTNPSREPAAGHFQPTCLNPRLQPASPTAAISPRNPTFRDSAHHESRSRQEPRRDSRRASAGECKKAFGAESTRLTQTQGGRGSRSNRGNNRGQRRERQDQYPRDGVRKVRQRAASCKYPTALNRSRAFVQVECPPPP